MTKMFFSAKIYKANDVCLNKAFENRICRINIIAQREFVWCKNLYNFIMCTAGLSFENIFMSAPLTAKSGGTAEVIIFNKIQTFVPLNYFLTGQKSFLL